MLSKEMLDLMIRVEMVVNFHDFLNFSGYAAKKSKCQKAGAWNRCTNSRACKGSRVVEAICKASRAVKRRKMEIERAEVDTLCT